MTTRYRVESDMTAPRLVQGANPNYIYVVEGGKRQQVPDVHTFRARGYDPQHIEVVSEQDLAAIPVAPMPRLMPASMLAIDLDSFLGAGHYMTTHGALYGNGHIDAQTRTRTITWFGGYHGAVYLVFSDANGIPKGMTQPHVFGVDGTWVGQSDRTDYWAEDIDPSVAEVTTSLAVFHSWAPTDLQQRIQRAIDLATPILQLIKDIKSTIGDGKTT